MEDAEIKLRLVEAAAKSPTVHPKGQAAGVLALATEWYTWVTLSTQVAVKSGVDKTLRLPKNLS